MIKSAILATVLGLSFIAPAYAASEFVCDETSMTKMKTSIEAMTDKDKQTASMKEWQMGSDEMKGNKLDDCQKRMRQIDEQNNSSGAGN
jgi:polysaccharide pyruvyl transferase WcaK-like protein